METGPPQPFDRRRAGVLLHPTSLPGPCDFGTLGDDATRFVDFLAAAGFTLWQTLPLGPVDSETLSPYAVRSTEAGNPRLIDLKLPADVPWRLTPTELGEAESWPVRAWLTERLWQRFRRMATREEHARFLGFVRSERSWLLPFCLFDALRTAWARPWWEWPEPLRVREPKALREARHAHRPHIRKTMFEQYLFDTQWTALKNRANQSGIRLFGDLPVYADRDSVDVWWRRDLFRIDGAGRADVVSGVPPDYFSEDGQLWGHPIYDWPRMEAAGFQWWADRIRRQLRRFDLLRIDHFRALEAYWEIPGDAPTARTGRWVAGPGAPLLEALGKESLLGALVAEDLGVITPAVRELRDRFGLPGMLVLQFAFDGSRDNPFLPENHVSKAVVYTGTHDNDTTLGWFEGLPEEVREAIFRVLGRNGDAGMPGALIEAALASPAMLAMLPMQDVLALGPGHRMNTPGTTRGNWNWRFSWTDIPEGTAETFRALIERSGRLASAPDPLWRLPAE